MGFEVNQDKAKYMDVGRESWDISNLQIKRYIFRTVFDLKYLNTNINNTNNMPE